MELYFNKTNNYLRETCIVLVTVLDLNKKVPCLELQKLIFTEFDAIRKNIYPLPNALPNM